MWWWRGGPEFVRNRESAFLRDPAGCGETENELQHPSIAAKELASEELMEGHRFGIWLGALDGVRNFVVPGVLAWLGVGGQFPEP